MLWRTSFPPVSCPFPPNLHSYSSCLCPGPPLLLSSPLEFSSLVPYHHIYPEVHPQHGSWSFLLHTQLPSYQVKKNILYLLPEELNLKHILYHFKSFTTWPQPLFPFIFPLLFFTHSMISLSSLPLFLYVGIEPKFQRPVQDATDHYTMASLGTLLVIASSFPFQLFMQSSHLTLRWVTQVYFNLDTLKVPGPWGGTLCFMEYTELGAHTDGNKNVYHFEIIVKKKHFQGFYSSMSK